MFFPLQFGSLKNNLPVGNISLFPVVGCRILRFTFPHVVRKKGDFEFPITLLCEVCRGADFDMGKIQLLPRLARSGSAYCGRFPQILIGLICVSPIRRCPLHPTSFMPISIRNSSPGISGFSLKHNAFAKLCSLERHRRRKK